MSQAVTAILTGPTATGKTSLSIDFAQSHGRIEIINADSMLVYRGMDIGTAKPSLDERRGITHHLIDIKTPDEAFTAGAFVQAVKDKISEIHSRSHRALIVGGTGFYLKALLFGQWAAPASSPAVRAELDGLQTEALYQDLQTRDPEAALKIGHADRYRIIRAIEIHRSTGKTLSQLQSELPSAPDPRFALYVIDRATDELDLRIRERTRLMLSSGLLAEVSRLLADYPGARALKAVGYRQTVAYLRGEAPSGRKIAPGLPGLGAEIELATRQLVKQQRTWFRSQYVARSITNFTLERDRQTLLAELEQVYR